MSSRLCLQLSLPHDWDQIDPVRQAVTLCVGAVFGKKSREDSISMVASELLENAIKHGSPGSLVHLSIEESERDMSVVVTNRTSERDGSAFLRERIDWIDSFADSSDAYSAAMEKAFVEMSDGGLGLPRIAHEGGCKLTLEPADAGVISVRARLRTSEKDLE